MLSFGGCLAKIYSWRPHQNPAGSARAFYICLLLLFAEMNGNTPMHFNGMRAAVVRKVDGSRDVRDGERPTADSSSSNVEPTEKSLTKGEAALKPF